jgi:hypothetical protein
MLAELQARKNTIKELSSPKIPAELSGKLISFGFYFRVIGGIIQ